MNAERSDVPQDLKCTYKKLVNSDFTEGMARIEWSTVNDATGYEVYCEKDNRYESLGATDKTSYILENLKEGETYTIAVKACKDEAKSDTCGEYSGKLDVNVSKKELGVRVFNGNMIGTVNNGVYSYKGIHYAQDAGKPETRWKKPVPAEAGSKDTDASGFGKTAFQVPWHSEAASITEQGEDCLTLDIWTTSPNDTNSRKPVFVWIHGGSNILGGSTDPIYTGQNLIETCGNDVVYVSVNYRLNCMGVMNFSKVEGGENYPDAGWLSLYDDIQALRWIKDNIRQFGGDPDQVTIAGESAGGTHVSMLPLMEECEKEHLFDRVICQSGTPMASTPEASSYEPTYVMMDGYKYAECLDPDKIDQYGTVKGLGKGRYPTMDDLANLSEKEMWTLMYYCGCCSWDEESHRAYRVTDSAGDFSRPIRGGQDNPLLNARFDESVEKMLKKYRDLDYIDLMIGTTANEYDYWIGEQSNKYKYDEKGNLITYTAPDGSQKPVIDDGAAPAESDYRDFNDRWSASWNARYLLFKELGIGDEVDAAFEKTTVGNTGAAKGISKEAMKGSMLATEISGALPSQMIADNHANSHGKTYMYYWKHPADTPGFNAGHSVELAYVFGVDSDVYMNRGSGTTDKALIDKTMKTWMSFVKDGKPAVADQKIEWPEYDAQKKKTMVVNDTSKNPDWTVEENPDNEIRELLTNKDGKMKPIEIEGKTYTSFFDFLLNGVVLSNE